MARRRPRTPSQHLAAYFVRGLLIFVPTVGTVYAVWLVLSWLDSAMGAAIPGLGLVLTLGLILLTGFVFSNVVGQAVLTTFEAGIRHLPLVSLLYTSLKDLLGAFVGDKKSFDRPVMVSLDETGKIRAFGFVTCEKFDDVRLKGFVSVYLPQSYNFAGNLIVVPKDRIEAVDADPAQFMAFIVSGGVAAMGGAKTVLDDSALSTRPSVTRL